MINLLFILYLFILILYPIGIIILSFNIQLYENEIDQCNISYLNNINTNFILLNKHDIITIEFYYYVLILIHILLIKRIKYFILFIYNLIFYIQYNNKYFYLYNIYNIIFPIKIYLKYTYFIND